MKIKDMDSLYVESLRDLYSAETQLTMALPTVADAVSSKELKKAVLSHLKETENHVARLEEIFKDLDEDPSGHECAAMKGLIKEAEELMKDVKTPAVLDSALIGAAQKVEHYEIAGYGTVRTLAQMLGKDNHARILDETIKEEGACDKKLTQIAESGVNEESLTAAN